MEYTPQLTPEAIADINDACRVRIPHRHVLDYKYLLQRLDVGHERQVGQFHWLVGAHVLLDDRCSRLRTLMSTHFSSWRISTLPGIRLLKRHTSSSRSVLEEFDGSLRQR